MLLLPSLARFGVHSSSSMMATTKRSEAHPRRLSRGMNALQLSLVFFWIVSNCTFSAAAFSLPTGRNVRGVCSLAESSDSSMSKNDALVPPASEIRRALLLSVPLSVLLRPSTVSARGLVQFPCKTPLFNTYHLMRAGTSLLEEDDIWSTNPLFLTNREDALSPAGQDQVVEASQQLKSLQRIPTVIKYSLAASCVDTANIIARELKLGRDRIVPEFTFLDPRAIGQWDMLSKQSTQPAVWAMDVDEAGPNGLGGRPPPNEDSTPHEVLADQAVRLRQIMSVIESQSSGDTVLLIFPDGTGPALLSAMIAGIPYDRVHEIEFGPGEVRLDVTMASTLDLWKAKQGDETYLALIEDGRKKLAELRATDSFVNIRDQQIEDERLEIEKVYKEKRRLQQVEEDNERQQRATRQKQDAASSKLNRGGSVSPSLVGLAALLGVSGAYIAAESQDVNDGKTSTETTKANDEEPSKPPLQTNDPFSSTADLYGDRPIRRGNGGDKKNLFNTPEKPVNRRLAAQQAMEEYLDRDDGGDAWLQSITDIIEEPDSYEPVDESSSATPPNNDS